ncbi:glycosyltransferase family 39 protein [Spongiimicrobium salis]|uniref:glycosyltransferase family 39 protein n=1 Tax=Spongiimicrobium salis TaxID=1667022 RepID=UPI00374D7CF9
MNIGHPSYSFFDYKSTFWIPFFLGALIILTVVLYLNFPSAYNQGLYHYQGLVMKNGGLPYTGFIEKKGPMGLLTYALASLIFGETSMAYRFFDLLILGIIGFFLFRLSQLKYSKSIGYMAIVFWLQHVLIDGPGNTADVTNIITACYVAVAYYMIAPTVKNRYFRIGILVALACWVKPTALLIAVPLLLPFLRKSKNALNMSKRQVAFQFLLGLGIPSIVFTTYLLLSNTFYGFWEAVVLDTVYNYAGNVSRISFRVLSKTGRAFLHDPVLRIGGLLGLFIFSKNTMLKLLTIGIGLMLIVEGRLYPYQYSILWPFLTLGLIEMFTTLHSRFSENRQKVFLGLFCILMAFPLLKTGPVFIRAGFATPNFDAGQTFLAPDFKTMYSFRKPVVSYLKTQVNPQDEVLVLGQDPNIYLELGAITSCRLAREGRMLTKEPTFKTPSHIVAWQKELIAYMQSNKADWIVVLKTLPGHWANSYSPEINSIFSEKYELKHTTEGHLIYKKS